MKDYTVFNSSGIRAIYTTTLDNLLLNLLEEESYTEGKYSDEYYYVREGSINAFPAKPDYPCTFNKDLGVWEWDTNVSWGELRLERDYLLTLCDWTQAIDAPLNDTQKQAWQNYRQQLRDLPSITTDPRTPTWPTKPT